MNMDNLILVAACVGILGPWIFLLVLLWQASRTQRTWREMLVTLKSATAYEAQDALDRMKSREKSMIQKGLENIRKKDDTLSDSPVADMADDIRGELAKKYDNDNGTGK